jgi:hypothetical protein
MNIIFQDIDGPLIPGRMYFNREARHFPNGMHRYDPIAVEMLREICLRTEAKIVYNTSHNEDSFARMREKADANGFLDLLDNRCRTDFGVDEHTRLSAIEKWVKEEEGFTATKVNWIVIDDERIPTDRLVHVSYDIGLTISNFCEAVAKLGGVPYMPMIPYTLMGK